MTELSRLVRGALPVLFALAAVAASALPANAGQQPAGDPARAAQWWLTTLHVPQAWAAAPGEGAGVTVAVLSTRVDPSHQDLSGAVLSGPDYSGSGRAAGGPFWGVEGTAVAGLIAGHGHGAGGATGSEGVAPRARILSLRVTLEYDDPLNSDSTLTKQLPNAIAAGIRYAVDHGARVIALPLDPGMLGPPAGDPAAAGGSPDERAAVGYAVTHGVVLVAPAGDNGGGSRTVSYPAAYPGVLAVGATTQGGQPAPFTNTGSYVALAAPGSGITVAAPGGGYGSLASTDMSAALTAGVAALIRSRFPGLTAAEATQAIERGVTARPGTPPAPGTGRGAVDAAGALTAAAAIAARPGPSPTGTATPARAQPAASPAARQAGTPRATARRSGAGPLASSLLQDAVIAAGVLIVGLATALTLSATRRRKAAAARSRRVAPAGGSHARRPRAALPAAPAAGNPKAADPWRALRAPDSAGGTARRSATPGTSGVGPRLAPTIATGSLSSAGAARRRRGDAAEPPWEPANPPGTIPSAARRTATAPRTVLPQPSGAAVPGEVPPWELGDGELAAAPVPADLPALPVSSSGPMYIWNPAASGPLPVLNEDEPDS